MLIILVCFCTNVRKREKRSASDTLIYQCYLDKVIPVDYKIQDKGVAIPDGLIISPGEYTVSNAGFKTVKEGLLRIMLIGKENYQRIVFEKDTLALLSALSWITTHGDSDKGKSNDELTSKALSGKLFLTCGPVSNWAISILDNLNINAREVMTLTLEPWNNYDNGHNMIEVEMAGQWVLFDLDNNVFFSKNGLLLNLKQFSEGIKNNDYEIHYLSNDIKIQTGWGNGKGYDLTLYSEFNISGEETLKKWYGKVVNVIFIEKGGIMYFPEYEDTVINNRIISYSKGIKPVDKVRFDSAYYVNK